MFKIVLFKSESDGPDRFVEELQKHNFSVQSITSIDFGFKNLELLSDKLNKLDDYEGIVFTSPRSIIATQKSTDNKIFEKWNDKELNYTVGESTGKLAADLLNLSTKGQEAGHALKLSAIIANDFNAQSATRPLLFPCGNLKQDILGKNLSEHSIKLDAVEVYDTIPHPNLEERVRKLKEEDSQFFVLFSPSSIKFSLPFINKHQLDLAKIKFIAIGPSTKKCLIDNKLTCYGMCEKPSPESLLNVLLRSDDECITGLGNE